MSLLQRVMSSAFIKGESSKGREFVTGMNVVIHEVGAAGAFQTWKSILEVHRRWSCSYKRKSLHSRIFGFWFQILLCIVAIITRTG
jgi:hypothetical protein